jgi:hypothetical protein
VALGFIGRARAVRRGPREGHAEECQKSEERASHRGSLP